MNCQPNDLAFIVRNTTGDGCVERLIGTPLTVESHFKTQVENRDAWTMRGGFLRCPSCRGVFLAVLDADLQPMRGQRPGQKVSVPVIKPSEKRDEVTA
jgi:hypothetical protein